MDPSTNETVDSSEQSEVKVTEHTKISRHQVFMGLLVVAIFALLTAAVLTINNSSYSLGEPEPSSDFVVTDGEGNPIPADELAVQFSAQNYDRKVLSLNQSESIGYYFSDQDNFTLYRLREDKECDETCGVEMMPYTTDIEYVSEDEFSRLSTVLIGEETHHYHWSGRGLYFYVDDVIAEDILGDGLNNNWELVRP